ncbi:ornithine cyclodeaminase family protein [Cytobacillus oceanisediminis]|uniref:Ornithine cyclodeaminase n=1 Tax=Cytobacillus oceanisediminis 2691 TaxID=1196031 RepID=A0A160MCB5_9BACI|nr:ornithine cyclodeaminase [Cytobacillus oceanisediminis]AND40556.1 ornithine cyclodeaminase [Cytobacillus oceanisediminis 2691]MCM3401028.1 ornithine cyclodeaminase family protein [Cytobacillus oceanisediminis]
MLMLNALTIKELYSMKDCIEDVEKAFCYGYANNTVAPIRVSIPHEKLGAETLYMPSYIEPENYTAIKVVSIFPNNIKEGRPVLQGVILLTNALTGEHVAVMDASYLTVLRTGASSGVATKYLARKDSKVCTILGCGAQAIGQIQAVMAVVDLEHIILFNRTIERADVLKEELHSIYPDWKGTITIQANANNAVSEADIIICSSKSSTPLFDGTLLKKGTHINAIGSYQPEMQEVDVQTLNRSNKIVVDTLEGVLHEAGDFLVPQKAGLWSSDSIYSEIGEIICGKKIGRETQSEITFYKSVGIGYLDTMVATSVYKKAIRNDKGDSLIL